MAARIAAENGWLLDDASGKIVGRLDLRAVLAALRGEAIEATAAAPPGRQSVPTSGFFGTDQPAAPTHPEIPHAA
jgi:hypothetical protein